MALQRIENWDTKALHPFIQSRKTTPFKWAENDCCLFPADAIKAMTGTDIATDFRSKYTDEASAFALIKSVTGGTTVADAAAHCASKFGMTEWSHPLLAKRGDLVVVQNGPQLIAGIIDLTGRYAISVGPSGLIRIAASPHVTRAWKV